MIPVPLGTDLVRGVAELEPTPRGLTPHRVPRWAREQFPDPQLLAMEAQPSGARIVFRSTATRFELVTHPTHVAYVGTARPRGRIDVVVDGALHVRDELTGGDRIEIDLRTGVSSVHAGPDHTTGVTGLPPGDKMVEVWLPHNESTELVALSADAAVESVGAPGRVWVHHGSSISHGSNATAPSQIWPAVAARGVGGVELRNLGLGGSALVDPFMARVIRDIPADIISVKLGINVVNFDAMRLRAFVPAVHGFLDTIREGHPRTPLILISPIFCDIHEDTPGPGGFDPATLGTDQVMFTATGTRGDTAQGRLTLDVIRDALRSVAERRADDQNLHHVNGLDLYGPADAGTYPLPDGLHPSTEAHRLIGERFAEHLHKVDTWPPAGPR
ncbi:GDSL-type esterase/lipase family protein [Micromonospora sp. WMMD1082]|uniref:GDSL-type esterase/lipase family protein n=1 Tax=Micromonospora sp. WMMD1082 TaxID=3016104 RepID=UPI002416C300|nr:GDSL-type esterase/lipase family protein [Micromonospora sp. WMMD1082]MDG4798146.1 SGNH/GDSL hydrolase family protein [Micromonospora sp. WMMD1082]